MLLFSSILLLETSFHFNQDKIGCTVLTGQLTRCLKNNKSIVFCLHYIQIMSHHSQIQRSRTTISNIDITVREIREPRLVFPQQLDAMVKSDETHCSGIVTWTLIPAIKKARNSNLTMCPEGERSGNISQSMKCITDQEEFISHMSQTVLGDLQDNFKKTLGTLMVYRCI